MKIEEFIEEYKKAKDKKACLRKHVKREYVPFEEKVALCERIRDHAMLKEVNEKQIFFMSSPVVYELFVCVCFSNYTDIEIGQGEDMLKSFNVLEEYDLYKLLLSQIQDVERFYTVLCMTKDDAITNNSIVSFLETKFDSLNILFKEIEKAQ